MPPAGFVHVEMSEEDDDLAMKIELRRKLDCIGLDDIIDDYSDFGMSLDVIDNDLPAKPLPSTCNVYLDFITKQHIHTASQLEKCDELVKHNAAKNMILDSDKSSLPTDTEHDLMEAAASRGCSVKEYRKKLLKELDCDSMTIEEFYVFCNENEVALPAHSLEKTTHPVCDNIPLDRVATFPRGTDSGNMSTCPSGESPVFTLTNRFHEVTGSSLDVAELDRQQSVSSICSDDSKHDECVGNRQPATTTFSTDDKIEDLNGQLVEYESNPQREFSLYLKQQFILSDETFLKRQEKLNQFDSALQEFMKKRAEDEEMSSRLEQNLLLANRVLMQEKDQLAKQNEECGKSLEEEHQIQQEELSRELNRHQLLLNTMTTRLEDESYQLEEDRKSRAEHQVKLFSSASTVIQRHYRGYRARLACHDERQVIIARKKQRQQNCFLQRVKEVELEMMESQRMKVEMCPDEFYEERSIEMEDVSNSAHNWITVKQEDCQVAVQQPTNTESSDEMGRSDRLGDAENINEVIEMVNVDNQGIDDGLQGACKKQFVDSTVIEDMCIEGNIDESLSSCKTSLNIISKSRFEDDKDFNGQLDGKRSDRETISTVVPGDVEICNAECIEKSKLNLWTYFLEESPISKQDCLSMQRASQRKDENFENEGFSVYSQRNGRERPTTLSCATAGILMERMHFAAQDVGELCLDLDVAPSYDSENIHVNCSLGNEEAKHHIIKENGNDHSEFAGIMAMQLDRKNAPCVFSTASLDRCAPKPVQSNTGKDSMKECHVVITGEVNEDRIPEEHPVLKSMLANEKDTVCGDLEKCDINKVSGLFPVDGWEKTCGTKDNVRTDELSVPTLSISSRALSNFQTNKDCVHHSTISESGHMKTEHLVESFGIVDSVKDVPDVCVKMTAKPALDGDICADASLEAVGRAMKDTFEACDGNVRVVNGCSTERDYSNVGEKILPDNNVQDLGTPDCERPSPENCEYAKDAAAVNCDMHLNEIELRHIGVKDGSTLSNIKQLSSGVLSNVIDNPENVNGITCSNARHYGKNACCVDNTGSLRASESNERLVNPYPAEDPTFARVDQEFKIGNDGVSSDMSSSLSTLQHLLDHSDEKETSSPTVHSFVSGAELRPDLEKRRLDWIRRCVPWIKIKNSTWGHQYHRNEKMPHRPFSAKKLTPFSNNVILQSVGVASLEQVTTIELCDLLGHHSLMSLSNCVHLQHLAVNNCQLTVVDGLSGCIHLHCVDVQSNMVQYVDVRGLTELYSVNLSRNNLSSIHGMAGCGNIRWLDVSHNKISSLAGLSSLPSLHTLQACCNPLVSAVGMGQCSMLQHVDLSDNYLSALDELHLLPLLGTLRLDSNSLSQMPILDNNILLHHLTLNKNSIGPELDLSKYWLPLLTKLDFSQNMIQEMSGSLDGFPSLKYLDLSLNQISEVNSFVPVISSCPRLEHLRIVGNAVLDEENFMNDVLCKMPWLKLIDGECMKPCENAVVSSISNNCYEEMCLSQVRQYEALSFAWNTKQEAGGGGGTEILSRHRCEDRFEFFEKSFQMAVNQRYAHEYGEVPDTDLLSCPTSCALSSTLSIISGDKLHDFLTDDRYIAENGRHSLLPSVISEGSSLQDNVLLNVEPKGTDSESVSFAAGISSDNCINIVSKYMSSCSSESHLHSFNDAKLSTVASIVNQYSVASSLISTESHPITSALFSKFGGKSDVFLPTDTGGSVHVRNQVSVSQGQHFHGTDQVDSSVGHGVSASSAEGNTAMICANNLQHHMDFSDLSQTGDNALLFSNNKSIILGQISAHSDNIGKRTDVCLLPGVSHSLSSNKNQSNLQAAHIHSTNPHRDLCNPYYFPADDNRNLTRDDLSTRPFYQNESSFGDLFDENVELKNDDVELNNDVYLMLEQISLEQDRLDSTWILEESADLSIKAERSPPSSPFGFSMTQPSLEQSHMPREAWRSAGSSSIRGADALSQINSSPSSVTIADESSQDVSCMRSERGRKLAEEWGLQDPQTVEMMMRRAKRMKYNAERRHRMRRLDPRQRLDLIRKLEKAKGNCSEEKYSLPTHQSAANIGQMYPVISTGACRENYPRESPDHSLRSRTKLVGAYEWVHTPVEPCHLSVSSKNTKRIPSTDVRTVEMGVSRRISPISSTTLSPSGHGIVLSHESTSDTNHNGLRQPFQNPYGVDLNNRVGREKWLPPITSPSSSSGACLRREKMSWRSEPVNRSVGWGGGKKRFSKG